MAVDFAHPVVTDLYSGTGGGPDWPTYIQDNIAAVASWLDGADPAGKRTGFKRISGGEIQEWNGSAWVRRALNYFSSGGGNVTGAVNINPGPLTLTLPTNPAILALSGSAGASGSLVAGRTGAELYMGVVGVAGNFVNGSAVGDAVITNYSGGALRFGLASTGQITISPGVGTVVGSSFSAVGNIITFTALPSFNAGNISGFPAAVFYNPGAGLDAKRWDIYANATTLTHRIVNDANTNAYNWLEVVRTGLVINSITFPNGNIGFGGVSAGAKVDIQQAAPAAGAVSLRILDTASNLALQLIRTGSAYNYGGVGPNQSWLYSQGSSDLNLGPDGAGKVAIVTNGARRVIVTSDGIVGINRAPTNTILEASGIISAGYSAANEGFRIVSDTGYMTFYNAALTTRRAYIQHATGDFLFSNEANGNFYFIGGGTNRFVMTNDGRAYVGPVSSGNRVITAAETDSSSFSAVFVGGVRLQWGKVTTTANGGGTVTFGTAFTTLLACIVSDNLSGGSGWVPRNWNHTTSGFTYGADNYNTAGGGLARVINYLAIGF